MIIAILTLFPEGVRPYLEQSILGLAERKGLLRFLLVDFRAYARDPHRSADDRPFGGGPGMVLKPEPIFEAIEDVERSVGPTRKLLLTPRGRRFDQRQAQELAREERLLLLCGRYEGIDERVHQAFPWTEVSLGDFVLSGGELPALAVAEAVARLVPGVLGDPRSALEDSFADGETLDCPHYTRPRVYRGMEVPDVLLSGNHAAIRKWRLEASARLTEARRAEPGSEGDPPPLGANEETNDGPQASGQHGL